jgi:hypothetical protein
MLIHDDLADIMLTSALYRQRFPAKRVDRSTGKTHLDLEARFVLG